MKTILHIAITLRGPLLSQSSNPGPLGLDVVLARNHQHQPYIPGTLISGKIRQALEELQDAVNNADNKPDWFAPKVDAWLGKASVNDFAKTKQLFFSDFVLDNDQPLAQTRYRIKIDTERGSVLKHHLVMLESPFTSGEDYTFTGQVHYFSAPDQAETIHTHLHAAIKWFSHLGAFRSIGFGQVVKASISEITPPCSSTPNAKLMPPRVGLIIQPLYPFCLAGKPNADNLFTADAIIPGAAIKGCMATTWNQLLGLQSGKLSHDGADYPELRQNFSKIRILHAFPSHAPKQRPVVAPLSLVKIHQHEQLYDVAQLKHPCLIKQCPPHFALDWKDTDTTLKDYPWPYLRFKNWGWCELATELRVRTAIDRDQRRSATSELFAYEQIIPDNTLWYSELDLSRVDEAVRGLVLEQLQTLCAKGLFGLGKTKSPLSIDFVEPIEPVIPNQLTPLADKVWIITLQTDTLLGSPEDLNEASGKAELEKMYSDAWHELSQGQFKLVRYFARQRLSGGKHRHKLMQQNDNNAYKPWLLTEAGSVFVLQGGEGCADIIKQWLAKGLPISAAAKTWYGLGTDEAQVWRYTPFVPENGYGEIAVNLQHNTILPLTDNSPLVTAIKPNIYKREEN
ncbi:MAG: hypothetical protein HOP34_11065 [Methylococcaceae bacterium]|nr:hypothetical protein [Methylococcaceae bacterium]